MANTIQQERELSFSSEQIIDQINNFLWKFYDDVLDIKKVMDGKPVTIDIKVLYEADYARKKVQDETQLKEWEKKYVKVLDTYYPIIKELRENYDNAIDLFKEAIGKYVMEKYLPLYQETIDFLTVNARKEITVKLIPFEDDFVPLKELSYLHENKGIAIRGKVITMGQKQLTILRFAYRCLKHEKDEYGQQQIIYSEEGKNLRLCPLCQENGKSSLLIPMPQHHIRRDLQFVILRELNHDKEYAEIRVHLYDKLCWSVHTGQKVVVYGKLGFTELSNGNSKNIAPVQYPYIIANNIYESDDTKKDFIITPEMEARFMSLMKKPNFYDILVKSFAPNIEGMELAKECCILAICSVKMEHPVNVLFAADPGMGKTEILKFCEKVVEKGEYVNFATVKNYASLSAFAYRDELSGQIVVQNGTFPDNDEGMIFGDEFQSVKIEIQEELDEWLQDKEVTFSKGGKTDTLLARTANIIACNSFFGYWNDSKSVSENMQFLKRNREAILSRLVLFFILKDPKNRESDIRKARKIAERHTTTDKDPLAKYMDDYTVDGEERFGLRTMRPLLKFLQNRTIPPISPSLIEHSSIDFADSRSEPGDEELRKLITGRYQDVKLILARLYGMLFNKKVADIEEFQRGYTIFSKAFKTFIYDAETKTYDTSFIECRNGKADNQKYYNKLNALIIAIKESLLENEKMENSSNELIASKLKQSASMKTEKFQNQPHAFTSLLFKLESDGILTYNDNTNIVRIDREELIRKFGELDADTK